MSNCNKNSHLVIITHKPLKIKEGIKFVTSPKCGAINTFLGTIRDMDINIENGQKISDNLKPIKGIFYEAHEPMAKKQISNIIESIMDDDSMVLNIHNDNNNKDNSSNIVTNIDNKDSNNFADQNCRFYVAIRLGRVLVSEASILICVSSTGRHYSHMATMFILEKIKSMVAIWKKVIYLDGKEKWADEAKSEASWLK